MTFRRSRSALGSLRLFYRSDVVAFCEGGISLTYDDALKPTNGDGTLDTLFWSNIADIGDNGKKIYFKSVGNKDTLHKILDDIIETECNNVSVCLDSDYDEHIGILRQHPRAAFTMGYSWESDVLSTPVPYQVLRHLVGPSAWEVEAELNEGLTHLADNLSKWCEIDISLRKLSKPCVLDRKKPLSIVDTATFPPTLNEQRMTQKLSEMGYKRRPKAVVKIPQERALNVVCGKVLGRIIYSMVIALANRFVPKLRLDYENFMRIAVRETFALLRTGGLPQLETHIRLQVRAFS